MHTQNRHSALQFGKHTVTKTAAPELMRIEIEKTHRAYEIGTDCGLFRVPKVLDYDEAKGVALLERIEGIEPISSRIYQDASIIERIGRSLAIIHQTLSLPDEMLHPLPPEFAMPGNEAFLHGDFNGCNICIQASSGSIVILDWQMTSRHGGQATYGSKYFDLIWFVNYMLWVPRISYLFHDPVSPAASAFLEYYFKQAKTPNGADTLARYAKNFFEVKYPFRKQHANWQTRYLLPRSRTLTERFVESLKTLDLKE